MLWDNNRRSVGANSGNGMVAYSYSMVGSGLGSGVGVGAVVEHASVIRLAGGVDMDVVCMYGSFSVDVVGWVMCVFDMQ